MTQVQRTPSPPEELERALIHVLEVMYEPDLPCQVRSGCDSAAEWLHVMDKPCEHPNRFVFCTPHSLLIRSFATHECARCAGGAKLASVVKI